MTKRFWSRSLDIDYVLFWLDFWLRRSQGQQLRKKKKKPERSHYPSILTHQASLATEGFLVWQKNIVFLTGTAGNNTDHERSGYWLIAICAYGTQTTEINKHGHSCFCALSLVGKLNFNISEVN